MDLDSNEERKDNGSSSEIGDFSDQSAVECQENKHKDYFEKVLADIGMPAELSVAKRHRDLNSVRRWKNNYSEEYKFWSSSTWKIGEFSLGLALYFTFIKQMIVMMTVVSCISVMQLYVNYTGGYFTGTEVLSELDRFTVGNVYGERNTSIEQTKADNCYLLNWISDAACSCVVLVCCFLFFIYSHLAIFLRLKKKPKISDFTVEIEGLPRSGLVAKDIEEHFSRFGEVEEVYFGKRFGEYLSLFAAKASITKNKMIREALLKFNEKNPAADKQLFEIITKLRKVDLKIINTGVIRKQEDLEINKAYVVFKTTEGRKTCLKKYNERNILGCKKRKKKLRFQKYFLNVKAAKEPSDIIWENLETGALSRLFRRILSGLVILVLLSLSFSSIYLVRCVLSFLPSESVCKNINKQDSTNGNTGNLCYCQTLSKDQLLKESEDCSIYLKYITLAWTFKYASAVLINVITKLLEVILPKLAYFEKPNSRNQIKKNVFKTTFLVSFTNTGVLIYLANLFIPVPHPLIFDGLYKDFTREWLLRVGSQILAVMMVSVIFPHFAYLFIAYPIGICRRKCCYKKRKTQYELNLLFTDPEFELASRYGQVLNVIFTCYLYSSGIPLLNSISLIFLVFVFYTDKWLVLKHYKRPQIYDQRLYLTSLKLIPTAVILHSCFALYIYGSDDLFSVHSQDIPFVFKVFPSNYAKRVARPSGVSNSVIFFVSLLLVLALNFTEFFCKCCFNKRTDKGSFSDFQAVKEEIEKRGLASYDIRKNPDYAMIIKEIDDSTEVIQTQSISVYASPKLQRSKSKIPLAPSPVKEEEANQIELDLGDFTSQDISQPDLSRDEQAEVYLDLETYRNPSKFLRKRNAENRMSSSFSFEIDDNEVGFDFSDFGERKVSETDLKEREMGHMDIEENKEEIPEKINWGDG